LRDSRPKHRKKQNIIPINTYNVTQAVSTGDKACTQIYNSIACTVQHNTTHMQKKSHNEHIPNNILQISKQ